MLFRRLIITALSLTLFLSLAGPGSAVRGSASTSSIQADTAVSGQITWWSHNNPAFVAANKALVASF